MWVSTVRWATGSKKRAASATTISAASVIPFRDRRKRMFIGHYGPALAAKAPVKAIPLWILFIAVQWLDVCWAALVLMAVEKVRIVPGFTQGSPLDLYYMHYTHGLIGSLILSFVFGEIVLLFVRERRVAVVAIVAGAVFSHWLLDLVVHVPDLPLFDNSAKVGFGLWRWLWISLPLELITLLVGAMVYVRAIPSKTRRGDVWLWTLRFIRPNSPHTGGRSGDRADRVRRSCLARRAGGLGPGNSER